MKKAHAFIGEIHNLQTADEVWNFATQSFSEIGLHRVSHGYVKDSGGEPQLDLRNNYPDFWRELYYERGTYKHDLYARYVALETKPILASTFKFTDEFTNSDAYTEICDTPGAELTVGYVVPLRLMQHKGYGGMYIGGVDAEIKDKAAYVLNRQNEIFLMGLHMDARLVALDKREVKLNANLSVREIECLEWLARGRLNDRIAEELGISNSTVEFHFRNARRKLNCKTREQALAKAAMLDIIPI